MQHLYPPTQHDSNAHPSASEIEAFRARQRMQFRYQQQQQQQQQVNHHHQQVNHHQQQLYEQHLRSLGAGNQAEERNEDDRVRKVSLPKRLQQFQQQFQQQQQQFQQQQQQIASSRTTRLPNFGVESRHHQHHHQQHMIDDDDVASPVPHTMFNAFDYGTSPEAFSFTEQEQHNHDHQHSNNNNNDQQLRQHDASDDEKSIWRRRFASDDAHLRRSPKLGRVALWDSTCPLGYGGGNNQFSHLQPHNHYQQQQQ